MFRKMSLLVFATSLLFPAMRSNAALTIYQAISHNGITNDGTMLFQTTAGADYLDAYYWDQFGARRQEWWSHCYSYDTSPEDRTVKPVPTSGSDIILLWQNEQICGCPGWYHYAVGEVSARWKATGEWTWPIHSDFESEWERQEY